MNKQEAFIVQQFVNAADLRCAALRVYCTAYGGEARYQAQVKLDEADDLYAKARNRLITSMESNATQKLIRKASRVVARGEREAQR